MKMDLKIKNSGKKDSNTASYGLKVPKKMKEDLLKLPAEERHEKTRKFFEALIKENAS